MQPAQDGRKEGGDSMQEQFVVVRQAAERKMAERSTRVDYFPMQLNSSGMMVCVSNHAMCVFKA